MLNNKKEEEYEYVGNYFGWRTSYWSLALIVILILIALARYYYLGGPEVIGNPFTEPGLDSLELVDPASGW